MSTTLATRRGTSNGNERGSSYTRRSRRAWMMATYASNIPGLARCYRCGCLLYNPDTTPVSEDGLPTFPAEYVLKHGTQVWGAVRLTVDRIIPGCQGGTYRRNNVRPACGHCNSETGGALATRGGKA